MMSFKASAPGSLMLLGEYAVLQGYPALVCAIDKRISVVLTPREDKQIHLTSQLGRLHTTLSTLEVVKPFEFVLTTLKKYQSYFHQGCDITIAAEFSNTMGFASSAAVTVATLSAVFHWLGFPCSLNDLLKEARSIIQAVQGMGSGADVAACVYGGLIAYEPDTAAVTTFPEVYPITVVYSGNKLPTAQAVQQVREAFAGKPAAFSHLMQKIGECASQGIQAVADKNWVELGKAMRLQQTYMEALGVNNEVLREIITVLNRDPHMLGAKISGAGLGDCVVGLGLQEEALPPIASGVRLVPVAIATQGVTCERY